MARTTSELVEGIIEVDSSISLVPFITAASSLIEEIAKDSGLGADRLALVETYLAAHFYTLRDPRPTHEKAGPVAQTYQSAVALNLATSHYGQMAMVLDTSGLLRNLSIGKRTASVTWVGMTQDEIRLLDS